MPIIKRPPEPEPEPESAPTPVDTSVEDTRQSEMLLVGLSLDDTAHRKKLKGEDEPGKRRSLDDMRRLSEEIKGVPTYRRK